MDDRQNNGRRSGDLWLGRAVKFVVVGGGVVASLAFGSRVMSNVDKIASLDKRLSSVEQSQPALLYMVCVLYRDGHANAIPAVCEQAISLGIGR